MFKYFNILVLRVVIVIHSVQVLEVLRLFLSKQMREGVSPW